MVWPPVVAKTARLLSDPKVVADRDAYQKYIREHAEISSIVAAFREFKRVDRELDDSLDLMHDEDPDMKKMAGEEVDRLEREKERLQEELRILLVPKDPLDDKNVILEIRAGTGGDEAGLCGGLPGDARRGRDAERRLFH